MMNRFVFELFWRKKKKERGNHKKSVEKCYRFVVNDGIYNMIGIIESFCHVKCHFITYKDTHADTSNHYMFFIKKQP